MYYKSITRTRGYCRNYPRYNCEKHVLTLVRYGGAADISDNTQHGSQRATVGNPQVGLYLVHH